MTEREISQVFAAALNRGVLQGFARVAHGWQVHPAKARPRTLTQAQAVGLARDLKRSESSDLQLVSASEPVPQGGS